MSDSVTVYRPHPYQETAIQFVLDHPRCLLSLDMGLGKTSIVLYAVRILLCEYAVTRVLVIAPLYVASDTWPREAEKWDFSQALRIRTAVGTEAKRREAIEDSSADIVCINRENLLWLYKTYGQKGIKSRFDMIVVDESSSFKTYSSKRTKVLRKLSPEMLRVVELSGTPRPRSIEDLFSQLACLDAGQRLGKTLTGFRTRYEHPGRRGPNNVVYEWIPNDDAEEAVYNAIADISISMKAKDLIGVPEEQIIDHKFRLSPAAKKIYRRLEKESVVMLDTSTVAGVNAGVLAGKLLQACNGAVYDAEGTVHEIHSQKLDILQEIIESTDQPVMVFYWYKHDLDRLQSYLAAYHPRSIEGPEDIRAWNEGKIRVLLAHPASMGHGLNLQSGGHIIVWFGLTWSLELYQQANARLWRQGQKERVQIHRIIAEGTVDEDVIASLERKDQGQEKLLEAIKMRIRKGQC